MYFKTLPRHIQDAIKNLTKDDVFQDRFGHDKILDELESEKNDPKANFSELMALRKEPIIIEGKKYNHLTMFAWSLLWTLQSPFVTDAKKPELIDIDLFLYIIDNPKSLNLESILVDSINYSSKYKLSFEELKDICYIIMGFAFKPLKMLPTLGANDIVAIPAYDVFWLTSYSTKIQKVTSYSTDYIINEMSLNSVFHFYIQYCRMQGNNKIERRPVEDILKAIAERTVDLIVERLVELNVIKSEEAAQYAATMKTIPTKNK